MRYKSFRPLLQISQAFFVTYWSTFVAKRSRCYKSVQFCYENGPSVKKRSGSLTVMSFESCYGILRFDRHHIASETYIGSDVISIKCANNEFDILTPLCHFKHYTKVPHHPILSEFSRMFGFYFHLWWKILKFDICDRVQ